MSLEATSAQPGRGALDDTHAPSWVLCSGGSPHGPFFGSCLCSGAAGPFQDGCSPATLRAPLPWHGISSLWPLPQHPLASCLCSFPDKNMCPQTPEKKAQVVSRTLAAEPAGGCQGVRTAVFSLGQPLPCGRGVPGLPASPSVGRRDGKHPTLCSSQADSLQRMLPSEPLSPFSFPAVA